MLIRSRFSASAGASARPPLKVEVYPSPHNDAQVQGLRGTWTVYATFGDEISDTGTMAR